MTSSKNNYSEESRKRKGMTEIPIDALDYGERINPVEEKSLN
jgi:hypothetical protein